MKVKWADELILKLKETGTGEQKLNLMKDWVVNKFKETGKRVTSSELLEGIKEIFGFPKYEFENHPNYMTYFKAKQIMETGEYVVPKPVDEFEELVKKFQNESSNTKLIDTVGTLNRENNVATNLQGNLREVKVKTQKRNVNDRAATTDTEGKI